MFDVHCQCTFKTIEHTFFHKGYQQLQQLFLSTILFSR